MIVFLARLIAALPLRVVQALGALAGWLAYLLSGRYRTRLRANLEQAGYRDAATRRAAIAEAGRQALEATWIWLRPPEDLRGLVPGEDFDRLKAQQRAGKPTVFLTPHLGCFEMLSKGYALHTHADTRTMIALYREPHDARLAPLMVAGRSLPGLQLAPATMAGVRLLMRALRSGDVTGILPDQVPSKGDGVWAPFFGRLAYTMTLPARLALACDANVVFFCAERLPRGRGFRVHCAPLEQPLTGDAVVDAAAINRGIEALIRIFPEQYLWGYHRYKVPAGADAPPDAAPSEAGA